MKSTFARVFTATTCLLLIAMLLVGAIFRLLAKDYLAENAINELKTDALAVIDLAEAAYTGNSLNTHDFAVAMSTTYAISGNDVVIFNADGVLLMCADAPLGCAHQGMTLSEDYCNKILADGIVTDECAIPGLYDEERYIVAVPIVQTGSVIGIVMVSAPNQETHVLMSKIFDIFITVSTIAVILSLILTSLIAHQQSAPLKELADTARAFGHGELKARIKTSENYPLELQELALAFNNMAASLEKSEYQRQEFVANVSHEIKTPMTTISGYVDGILDGTIPDSSQRTYLQIVSDEAKRLNRLVRSMLDISRLQEIGGVPESQKIHFDLCECAGRVLINFEQKILGKKLDVQVDFPEHPVYTIAQQDYVTQVIYNLVDNAVKFCPDGGVLALSIQDGGNKAYVSVANDGPTIPPEELSLVFDRFHKLDKSRSQNRDSWGLGLYIVKTIVDAHGENISVTSRDGRTTFTFTMPLEN